MTLLVRSSEFPTVVRDDWTPTLLVAAVGLIALLVAFAPTWLSMAKVWGSSETFGHGFLVAPITAWLVWRHRKALAMQAPQPSWFGVVALAACCLVLMAADLASINVVAHYAVTAMLVALVIAMAGWRVAAAIMFPLAFLFFMVPAGEAINPPLMEDTANPTIWAVQASGIPVFRDGLHFTLPTGRWSVIEACSGLRYVLASSMLGVLFAFLNFERWHKRVAFFLVSIGVAIVANWMRTYLIVMVGHFSNMRLGSGDDHVVYGWVFFGITMSTLFWMSARWRDASKVPAGGACMQGSESPVVAPYAPIKSRRARRSIPLAVLATVAVKYGALSAMRDVTPIAEFMNRALRVLGGLQSGPFVPGPLSVEPQFEGARAVVKGTLDPVHQTEVYLAYFARQEEGAKTIAFGNTVIADTTKSWETVSHQDIQPAGASAITIREWRLRQANRERLVWSRYTVGGTSVASEYKG